MIQPSRLCFARKAIKLNILVYVFLLIFKVYWWIHMSTYAQCNIEKHHTFRTANLHCMQNYFIFTVDVRKIYGHSTYERSINWTSMLYINILLKKLSNKVKLLLSCQQLSDTIGHGPICSYFSNVSTGGCLCRHSCSH